MKKILTENKIICQNETSIFNYFGWPTVGRLPNNTLAMVCSGFRTYHIDPFGKGVICYSFNEGKTWTKPTVFIDTQEDDRDCGIVAYGNGKVFINIFNNGIKAQEKIAEGYKPIKQYILSKAYLDSIDADEIDKKYSGSLYIESEDGGFNFGEIKKCPIQSPHGPCVTPEGNLIFVGNIVGDMRKMKCYAKTPDGDFEFLSDIKMPVEDGVELLGCEPHTIVLPNGKIIVHIRVTGGNKYNYTIFQSESNDGGKTFTDPHPIGLEHGAPAHIIRHSSGVLISSYGYRSEPYGERVMFSADDGKTWDTDYILRDDAEDGDLGYPSTVELNDGKLLTVYYQKESGSDHTVIMQSIWELPEKFRKCNKI